MSAGTRLSPYAKERILILSKEGKKYTEISLELASSSCPVSRQTISAVVRDSKKRRNVFSPRRCGGNKRVLTMEHYTCIGEEMSKNDELCAVGKYFITYFFNSRHVLE